MAGFSRRETIEATEIIELARFIVDQIADRKGEDIVLLDVRERTLIADYFVICNGTSERQLKAIVDAVTESVKKEFGLSAGYVEGDPAAGWVLVDYRDIIVHVFAPDRRSFYDLEGFWSEASVLLKIQ
jgi:ribosome-associated protein